MLPGTCLLLLGKWCCPLQAPSALKLGSISEPQKKGFLGRDLWRGSAVLVCGSHAPLLSGSLGTRRVNVYAGRARAQQGTPSSTQSASPFKREIMTDDAQAENASPYQRVSV